MPKRGSPALQVFIVVAVVSAFLYGFYSYHDQHTRLKRFEESGDKLKQKTESLSAQLQGGPVVKCLMWACLFYAGTPGQQTPGQQTPRQWHWH